MGKLKAVREENRVITARMLTTYHQRYVEALVARVEHLEKLVAELRRGANDATT